MASRATLAVLSMVGLLATTVAGCDEARPTLRPLDVPDLDLPRGAASDGGAYDLPSTPGDANDAGAPTDRPILEPDAATIDAIPGDASDAPSPDIPGFDVLEASSPDRPARDILSESEAMVFSDVDTGAGTRGSPRIDGVISTDWPMGSLVATNPEPSPWGSTLNALRGLRVAWDADRLYLGIDGVVEPQNALAVYLDRDFLPGSMATGVSRPTTLNDAVGALDDALSAAIETTPAGFGAELAWGTLGMQRKSAAEVRPEVGLRDIACARCAADFAWLPGDEVACGSSGCEIAFTWASIYGSGGSPPRPRIGVFVRIVNGTGTSLAPGQNLPPQAASPATVTAVATVSPTP